MILDLNHDSCSLSADYGWNYVEYLTHFLGIDFTPKATFEKHKNLKRFRKNRHLKFPINTELHNAPQNCIYELTKETTRTWSHKFQLEEQCKKPLKSYKSVLIFVIIFQSPKQKKFT